MPRATWSARSIAQRTTEPRSSSSHGWCVLLSCCALCPGAQQRRVAGRSWLADLGGRGGQRARPRRGASHFLPPPTIAGALLTRSLETQGSQPCPALMLGSHYDTVIDGGLYDGALGVVVAISAVKAALLELAPGNALRCPVRCSPTHCLFDRGLSLTTGGNRSVQRRRRRPVPEHLPGQQGYCRHAANLCFERL